MQIFLLLLDAQGRVVTRDALFDAGWGGAIVGDDSLNRAINRVRRIDVEAGPGIFELETIPRTGYRLIPSYSSAAASQEVASGRITRRTAFVAIAGAASVSGLGFYFVTMSRKREFNDLIKRSRLALDTADPALNPVAELRRAAEIRPDSAEAQGLLSYARSLQIANDQSDPGDNALAEADVASRRALSIDRLQPDALLARSLIERSTLDFAGTEDRLREILKTAPNHIHVMRHLWSVLQCVGRSHESLRVIERALAVKPLAAACHYPWAQLLWIVGRTPEADRVIDRALQYWPANPSARFARFMIFAFSGRAAAALAMLNNKDTAPQEFTPPSIALWKPSLLALDLRSPEHVETARRANLGASLTNLKLGRQAILTLSALGDLDSAFEVAAAVFAVDIRKSRTKRQTSSAAWRFAPWLFTPPAAALRADSRFETLCDQIGLSDYWAKRKVEPDYRSGTV